MTTPNRCQFWNCDETIRRNHFLCREHYAGYEAGAMDRCSSCGSYKDTDYDVCLNCYRQTAGAWASSRSNAAPPGDKPDEALLEGLCSLRRDLARRNRLQEFMVFSNETLAEMAAVRPMTPEAMLAINGVGPAKLERYGPDFLRVIRESISEPPARENPQPLPRPDSVPRDDREFATDKDTGVFFVYILLMEGAEYYIGQTNDILARLYEHRNNMTQSTRRRNPKLQWFTTVSTRREAADLERHLQQLNSNDSSRRQLIRLVVQFRQLVAELDYEPHQPTGESAVRESRLPYSGVAPPSTRPR